MTAARERTEGIPGGWRCPTLQQYRIPALHTSTSKNRNTVTTTFPLSFLVFFVYILSYVCLVVVCVQWRDSTSPLSVFLVFQESFFSLSLFFRIHSSAPTTRLCFGWISCDEIPHVYYRYTRR